MKGFGNLLEGYQRFRANRFETARGRWQQLAEGQAPRAIVIAIACFTRIEPAFQLLVPPFEMGGGRHGVSAALEFAVTQLNVPEIVVMGHEKCGGIGAALTGMFHGAAAGEGGFVHKWMSQIDEPAAAIAHEHGTGEDAQRKLEEVSIRQSLANLRTFPFVAEREKNGTLKLLGCHFSIRDGELWLLDEAEDRFRPV